MFSTRHTKSRDSKSVNDGGEFTGTLAKAPNGREFSNRRYQSQLLKQTKTSGNTWLYDFLRSSGTPYVIETDEIDVSDQPPMRSISTYGASEDTISRMPNGKYFLSYSFFFDSKGTIGMQRNAEYRKSSTIVLHPTVEVRDEEEGEDSYVSNFFFWFIDTSDWTVRQHEDGAIIGKVTKFCPSKAD